LRNWGGEKVGNRGRGRITIGTKKGREVIRQMQSSHWNLNEGRVGKGTNEVGNDTRKKMEGRGKKRDKKGREGSKNDKSKRVGENSVEGDGWTAAVLGDKEIEKKGGELRGTKGGEKGGA